MKMNKKNIPYIYVVPLFFLFVFFMFLIFTGRFSSTSLKEHENIQITDYSEILSYKVNQEDGIYMVIIYSERPESELLNRPVAKYLSQREIPLPLLLYNGEEQIEAEFEGGLQVATNEDKIIVGDSRVPNKELNNGITDPSEIKIHGFPTLIVVENGTIILTITGVEPIISFILNE